MKTTVKGILSVAALALTLVGCASNNANRSDSNFHANPSYVHNVNKNLKERIHVAEVTMPVGNHHSIMCDNNRGIDLPHNKSYSQYIHHAFQEVLQSADRLANKDKKANVLRVELTKVHFDSMANEWHIHAKVKVNHSKKSTHIKIATQFAALSKDQVCRNAMAEFNKTVDNFIAITLSNKEIVSRLNH